MQRFKSSPQARRFLSAHAFISTHDAIAWRPTAIGHRVPRLSKFAFDLCQPSVQGMGSSPTEV